LLLSDLVQSVARSSENAYSFVLSGSFFVVYVTNKRTNDFMPNHVCWVPLNVEWGRVPAPERGNPPETM
jgi:hypothetical protein